MKVHLIKSSEVDKELFTQVVSLLRAVSGPIQIWYDEDAVVNYKLENLDREVVPDRKSFETMQELMPMENLVNYKLSFPLERRVARWDVLFDACARHRRRKLIAHNEFVFLLTDVANENNWFATLDEKAPYNGFIHSGDWEEYMDCASAFPIAYEVIALMLQKHMFEGQAQLRTAVHQRPIGCMNDMCIQKSEVILKLRTADICSTCMEMIRPKLSLPIIHHALSLMESLRVKMLYAQNFRQSSPNSRLVIDQHKNLWLPDFGNIEIKLRPLEKALYFLFLQHPEGIFLSSLCDHRQELYNIYTGISGMGDMHEMRLRVDDMVNVLSNSANQKISRIKRVFTEAIGVELAKKYYIRGEVGDAKKIYLDRALVEN